MVAAASDILQELISNIIAIIHGYKLMVRSPILHNVQLTDRYRPTSAGGFIVVATLYGSLYNVHACTEERSCHYNSTCNWETSYGINNRYWAQIVLPYTDGRHRLCTCFSPLHGKVVLFICAMYSSTMCCIDKFQAFREP